MHAARTSNAAVADAPLGRHAVTIEGSIDNEVIVEILPSQSGMLRLTGQRPDCSRDVFFKLAGRDHAVLVAVCLAGGEAAQQRIGENAVAPLVALETELAAAGT